MLGMTEGRRGEGDNRGWDGWRASPTQWTGVWMSFSSWWWTGKPGMLRSMGLQRVRHDWATELNLAGSRYVISSGQYSWLYLQPKDFPSKFCSPSDLWGAEPSEPLWRVFGKVIEQGSRPPYLFFPNSSACLHFWHEIIFEKRCDIVGFSVPSSSIPSSLWGHLT